MTVSLDTSPLLAAARGRNRAHTPVWFMRQAGRSLPEYRQVREGTTMLESCRRPDLVTEITLQPVRRHGVDAAIFFSDIVVPLQAAGVEVEIVAGTGPVIAAPIRTEADVEALPELHEDQIPDIAESVRLLTAELGQTPLIGFAGAPFTLASYLIEGGPSRNHERTKSLMIGRPELFSALLGKLSRISETFLRVQLQAGASAFQLFDSWAGYLGEADYRTHVLPHSSRIFQALGGGSQPGIHFGVQTGELLTAMSEAGPDVVGVDFRVDLAAASSRVRPGQALQGNLDPALLFAPWEALRPRIDAILEAGRVHGERTGAEAGAHIFNLGHGVLPTTDPDALRRVVDYVHERTA